MAAEVGITITVSQSELKALISNLKQADTTAKSSKGGLSEWAAGALKAADHATRLHHTLRTLHFTLRLISELGLGKIVEQLQKGLEFRFYDDPIMQSLRKIDQETARMRNGFMDLFAPMAIGIAGALDKVSKDVVAFFKRNEKALREDVIGAFKALSNAAIETGTMLIYTASNIGAAWMMLGPLFKNVMNGANASLKEMGGDFYASLAKGAAALRLDGLAESIGEFGQVSHQEAAKYQYDQNKSQVALAGLIAQQRKFEDGLFDTAYAAHQAADAAAKLAEQHLKAKGLTSELSKGQQGEAAGRLSKAIDEDVLRENLDHALQIQKQFLAMRGSLSHEAAIDLEKKIDDSILHIQTERLKREGAAAEAIAEVRKAASERDEERMKTAQAQEEQRSKDMANMIDQTLLNGNLADALAAWRTFQERRQTIGRQAEVDDEKKLREGIGAKVGEQMKQQMDGSFVGLLQGWSTYLDNRNMLAAQKDAELSKELDANTKSMSHAMASTLTTDLTAIAKGTESVADAFRNMAESIIQDIVRMIIQMTIFKGMQAAMGAIGGLGGLGAKGGTAGVQVAGEAIIEAGTLFAAQGGYVTGGQPGRDSVPAMLTPGEFVLPADVVARVRGGAGSTPSKQGHFSDGGYVSASGGASTTVVRHETSVQHNVFAPMTRAGFEQMYRDVILPSQARMDRLGYTKVVR